MQKIGITGNIGSGKTTVCRVFEHFGVPVYYSDKEAKKCYQQQNIKNKLFTLFGQEIFTEMDTVDTKKLAEIVFNKVELLQKLNTLIHPLVLEDFEIWCKNHKNKAYILFESALIYSCKLTHLFDKIIFVDAPFPLIVERVMGRDKTSIEEIKKRLNKQLLANEEITEKDYIIFNNEKQLIIPQIIDIHQDLVLNHDFFKKIIHNL